MSRSSKEREPWEQGTSAYSAMAGFSGTLLVWLSCLWHGSSQSCEVQRRSTTRTEKPAIPGSGGHSGHASPNHHLVSLNSSTRRKRAQLVSLEEALAAFSPVVAFHFTCTFAKLRVRTALKLRAEIDSAKQTNLHSTRCTV
jgi:hypothetical protein